MHRWSGSEISGTKRESQVRAANQANTVPGVSRIPVAVVPGLAVEGGAEADAQFDESASGFGEGGGG